MTLQKQAQQILFFFGIGFLGANLKIGVDVVRFRRHRRERLLTWPRPRPPQHRLGLLLGVVQGLLLAAFVLLRRPPQQVFGLAMMMIYFLAAAPLSGRIACGFYGAGVWSDSGFVAWRNISGVAWRQEGAVTVLLISHVRNMARRLQVPGPLLGEARKLLREKVSSHDLHLSRSGLDLGTRDERDAV